MSITIKTPDEVEGMRVAGRLASQVLDHLSAYVTPGKTTNQLDRIAYDFITGHLKAIPAPLNYQPDPNRPAFPKSICTSVNHQVCHGIPSDKPLRKGDIVNIDVTVIKDGWHGDTSRMFMVGGESAVSIAAKRLCRASYESMWLGIQQIKAGAHISFIGNAIAKHAQGLGYSVVRDYCGHGVGRVFHEEPQVLHYKAGPNDKNAPNVVLEAGMTITVEPMINAGKYDTKALPDGWQVVTKDHSLSAQWEHTVLVTPTGFEVLTLSEGYPPLPEFVSNTKT